MNEKREYTIDELASLTRVPSRTIRFYQSKDALAPPVIRGRVAYYNDEHAERLKLIAELQDRGFQIKAIRDLVGRIGKGPAGLGDWLGLEDQLQSKWMNDTPRLVDESELAELIGAKLRPGLVGQMVDAHIIKRQGDRFLVQSPALLKVAVRLEEAGVALDIAGGGSRIIRKHMAKAAAELAEYFFKYAGKGFGREATAEDLKNAFRELRPKGLESIQIIFGQEMERELRKMVESGKTTAIPRGKKNP